MVTIISSVSGLTYKKVLNLCIESAFFPQIFILQMNT